MPHVLTPEFSARACVHTALLDAPVTRVFHAFANPDCLRRWWGPDGFSSRFEVFEFHDGGTWRFVMVGPDGHEYPNHNRFAQVQAPHRVVVEHLDAVHHFMLHIDLEAEGNGTRVHWFQVFDTATHRDQMAPFVHPANAQNLARWAQVVAGLSD